MTEPNIEEWINYLEAYAMAHDVKLNELTETVGALISRLGVQQERIDLLETELAKAREPDPRISDTIANIRAALESLDAGSVRAPEPWPIVDNGKKVKAV